MKYITCPTCGYFLGNISHQYDLDKEKICTNPKLSLEQQNLKIQTLINDLRLRRYCCKMRVLTNKNLVDDILPSPKNI